MLWKEKREKALALKHISRNYTSAFTNNRAHKTFLLFCCCVLSSNSLVHWHIQWILMTTAPGWDECWRVITGLWSWAVVKAGTFDINPNLHTNSICGIAASRVTKRQIKAVRLQNSCSSESENDIYLNLLLFRVGGLGSVKGGGSWMLSNSLMEKWQIPWGGMVDLDGRETACPQTYAESIAGASPSWHTWQKWKWVHNRNSS